MIFFLHLLSNKLSYTCLLVKPQKSMNHTPKRESDYFLDFYAASQRKQNPHVRVCIQNGGGIIGVEPQNGLSPEQKWKLNDIVKGLNRRGVYGSLMDTIIEKGLEGECGFEPEKKRIYFVSKGEKPVSDFLEE